MASGPDWTSRRDRHRSGGDRRTSGRDRRTSGRDRRTSSDANRDSENGKFLESLFSETLGVPFSGNFHIFENFLFFVKRGPHSILVERAGLRETFHHRDIEIKKSDNFI